MAVACACGGLASWGVCTVARATERRRARIEAYGRSLRAAEAALAAERDRAQTYFDIAGVVMLVLGPDGVVQRINHMGEELLGEQSATVTGPGMVRPVRCGGGQARSQGCLRRRPARGSGTVQGSRKPASGRPRAPAHRVALFPFA